MPETIIDKMNQHKLIRFHKNKKNILSEDDYENESIIKTNEQQAIELIGSSKIEEKMRDMHDNEEHITLEKIETHESTGVQLKNAQQTTKKILKLNTHSFHDDFEFSVFDNYKWSNLRIFFREKEIIHWNFVLSFKKNW